MHITKFAAAALTTLMLGTGLASAESIRFVERASPMNDSVNDAVQPSSPTDSINDAVRFDPEGSINDAVLFDPEGAIQDAVLDGAKPTKGGNLTVNGRDIVLALTCEAGGNELLTLRNKGDVVPAGTKLRWDVESLGERGAVRLQTALGSGETVRVDIGMDVDAGTPCAAKAI